MIKLNNIWEKYKKIQLIHCDNVTSVYKAKNILNEEYVVIKEIKKLQKDNSKILKEIKNLKKIKSKNIVSLIDIIESENSYYLIMELCYMSLEDYLKIRKEPLSIEEIREILFQINKGLKKIFDKKISHQNLKLSNILLCMNKKNIETINIKISDIGLNKFYNEKKKSNTNSPENLKGESILILSDLWSLGMIIYYMLFHEYPYNNEIISQKELNEKINKIEDKNLNDLLKKMLIINIDDRISWEEYLYHSFFKLNNKINCPSFNILCDNHSKNLIAYCSTCKKNICEICLNNCPGNSHNVIFFKNIGLSIKEINQFENLIHEIDDNIKNIYENKERIKGFLNTLKNINENNLIYGNDNKNNYKLISIQYLSIMKEKLFQMNDFSIPKIGWELRLLN